VIDRIHQAVAGIESCPLQERPGLLRRAEALLRRPPADLRAVEGLERDVQRAAERRAARAAARPAVTYPDLPVAHARERIAEAMRAHQVVVVAADTGSGKTTQLPKICLEAGRGIEGCITLTQPRRLAARSVAARIAEELGVPLGGPVGFKVRFDDRTAARSLVRVVTDGVLLAEIERDPRFLRSDTIIVDEAHERSLNIDFLLGFLRRLLPRRPDLKVIVASATIDVERFSRHFGGAPVVEVGGRMHPIEVRWRPDPDPAAERTPAEHAVRGIEECVAEGPGDVLAFLPGERDIMDAADMLARMPAMAGAEVLPLHARMPVSDQDRIFRSAGRRRVILATNIAETSVTVPGVRFVVDVGLARISRWSGRSRVLRLPIEPVSRASAQQRTGRCGRTGPGICVRTYSEESFESRDAFTPPELVRSNLASVILQMKALGLGEIDRFPFIDPPGPRAVAEGLETLVELGAIDARGALTPDGRKMSAMGVDPRLARLVLAGIREGALAEAAVLAAALSIQDPRERPAAQSGLADLAHAAFQDPESDFMSILRLWRRWRAESAALGSSALRRWCRTHFLSHQRLREWTELHEQLRSMLAERLRVRVPPLADASDPARIHRALLAAFVSQVGFRGEDGEYRTAGGTRFAAFPGSVLARRSPAWVVAAEVVETSRRFGRVLAKVQGDWVERVAPHVVRRIRSEPHWVRSTGQVAIWERVQYGELTVVARRRAPYGPLDPAGARDIFVQSALVDGDSDLDAPFVAHNRALRERVEAMEAKRRERGLLVDGEARFAFFDARVPEDVHSLPAFERWRRRAEATDPTILFMQASDLLASEPDPGLAERYPDQALLGAGAVADLRYRWEPGSAADGVHARIGLEEVWSVDAERLEWLVPGLLPQAIEHLVRSLPKGLRTRFFPLQELARDAASALPFGRGSLRAALAEYLSGVGATEIRPDMFDAGRLPPHLRLHVEVVDASGAVVAQGDDVAELRRRLAPMRAADREALWRAAFGPMWAPRHVRGFDLDELPERLEATDPLGRRALAFPALEDGADGVRLVLLAEALDAERVTRGGMRRLYAQACRDALTHHLEYAPGFESAALVAVGVTGRGGNEWRAAMELALAGAAFMDGRPIPRTLAEFESRMSRGSADLPGLARRLVEDARRIHERAARALRAIDGAVPPAWRESVADIRAQLSRLAPIDAVARVPAETRPSLCRWIDAVAVRAERLRSAGPDRDREAMAAVRRWEDELARAEAASAPGPDAALDAFRGLLEEYRVSLFAQELGTRVPVSEVRLERAWRDRDVRPTSSPGARPGPGR